MSGLWRQQGTALPRREEVAGCPSGAGAPWATSSPSFLWLLLGSNQLTSDCFCCVSVKASFETIYFYLSLACSLDEDKCQWKLFWFGALNDNSTSSSYFAGTFVQQLHRQQVDEVTRQLLCVRCSSSNMQKKKQTKTKTTKKLLGKAAVIIFLCPAYWQWEPRVLLCRFSSN